MTIRAAARSVILKRTQKENEDEWTAGGPAAVNGMSSEILYLLDSAQGLCMPQGNTPRRATGKLREETRSRRPIRVLHHVSQATSEALKFLIDSASPMLIDRVCPRSGISDEGK